VGVGGGLGLAEVPGREKIGKTNFVTKGGGLLDGGVRADGCSCFLGSNQCFDKRAAATSGAGCNCRIGCRSVRPVGKFTSTFFKERRRGEQPGRPERQEEERGLPVR